MRRMLPAEVAILLQGELLLHLLLVPLRVRRDPSAFRALHFRHVVLDLPHTGAKKITYLLYGKKRIPSTLLRHQRLRAGKY